MPMNKPHLEFHRLDMSAGWATPAGYPAGIAQKILASDLDERGKMGSRTRLLRFEAGVYTTAIIQYTQNTPVFLWTGPDPTTSSNHTNVIENLEMGAYSQAARPASPCCPPARSRRAARSQGYDTKRSLATPPTRPGPCPGAG